MRGRERRDVSKLKLKIRNGSQTNIDSVDTKVNIGVESVLGGCNQCLLLQFLF